MSNSILPCPFCSGSAELVDDDYVGCTLCSATGPVSTQKRDPTAAWNDLARRVADAAHTALWVSDAHATIAQMMNALKEAGYQQPKLYGDPAGCIRELAKRAAPQGDTTLGSG
jgi:hypothetical protein